MKSIGCIATISMMSWCNSVGDGCEPIASEDPTAASSSEAVSDSGTATTSTGAATVPTEATATTGVASSSTGEASTTTGAVGATTTSGETTMPTGESSATTTSGADSSTGETTEATGTSTGGPLPEAPALKLTFSQVKQFKFDWAAAPGADSYRLLESPSSGAPFVQIPNMNPLFEGPISLTMPLHLRWDATYQLLACNDNGCTPSAEVKVMDSLTALTLAVGYFKASNTGAGDSFGYSVAIADDGDTVAVGAPFEDGLGAVYVFERVAEGVWVQQAYVKATQGEANDQFGLSIALSADGNLLAVGAHFEDGPANSINGCGAVYLYTRKDNAWSISNLVRASNAGAGDSFGHNVALSADGKTLAVGAYFEDSSDIGINGMKNDNLAFNSGAVYVFSFVNPNWEQKAYVKPLDTAANAEFGHAVALSTDGNTLAVGAPGENKNQDKPGAAYVFERAGAVWSQKKLLTASNAGPGDRFGLSAAMSADGNTLAVGAYLEDSASTGIDGPGGDDIIFKDSGAAYVFVRGDDDWSAKPTYIKASNTEASDAFGLSVALSPDGTLLAITARDEDGGATGIGGAQELNGATDSGAVFVFERMNDMWSQRSYVKASNTGAGDRFGLGIALSNSGTLVVGADLEDSKSLGINKDQANDGAANSGAVYVY